MEKFNIKGPAYIARASGLFEELPSDTKISLEFAREVVGGYVERVAPRKTPEFIFLCNEEGHVHGLPLNFHGEELYGGPIAGDIIVIPRSDRRHREWL